MGILELIVGVIVTAALIALLYRLSSCNSKTTAWCLAYPATIVATLLATLWPMFWMHSRGECDVRHGLISAGFVIAALIAIILAEICGSDKATKAGRGR
jgi:hypothetical protein